VNRRSHPPELDRAITPGCALARGVHCRWGVVTPEQQREYNRRYYERNREKIREFARRRHAANPEKERELARRRRAANREKVREIKSRWYAANRKKIRERDRRRYAANREKIRERNRLRGRLRRLAKKNKITESEWALILRSGKKSGKKGTR